MKGIRVFVYFNLHRKCWSVKALEGEDKGRVIAHEDFVILRDAVGKVSKAGRERVLREKRKNVHAGIVGEWIGEIPMFESDLATTPDGEVWLAPYDVTYNPYKYDTFVYADNGQPYLGGAYMLMNANATNKLMSFEWEDVCYA